MKNEYKRTKTTVSLINYHFVFCPRYSNVEERFSELVAVQCKKLNIDILAMECHHDHVQLFLSTFPSISVPEIMAQIKGSTSRKIREEFEQLSKMPSLWTRSYFVSTAVNVSSETIKWYADT